jgi:hypothetical protein
MFVFSIFWNKKKNKNKNMNYYYYYYYYYFRVFPGGKAARAWC